MGMHKSLYIGPYVKCTRMRKRVFVAEFLDEAMFTIQHEDGDGVVFLAPNVSRGNDPRPDFDDDGAFCLELSGNAPLIEMEWFKQYFAPEIEKLAKVCESVEIKYGIHQYYA
jgi:hypothetical protein